jgi:hypothetical protein
MDLPSACPYCDSEHVNYTYLPGDESTGVGTLVFSCTDCASHVESPITDFEPPSNDPRYVPRDIPTQRPQPGAEADDHQQHPTPPRGPAG